MPLRAVEMKAARLDNIHRKNRHPAPHWFFPCDRKHYRGGDQGIRTIEIAMQSARFTRIVLTRCVS
jgi:hypothetical protein